MLVICKKFQLYRWTETICKTILIFPCYRRSVNHPNVFTTPRLLYERRLIIAKWLRLSQNHNRILLYRKLKFLHMTVFSPQIWFVIFVTNISSECIHHTTSAVSEVSVIIAKWLGLLQNHLHMITGYFCEVSFVSNSDNIVVGYSTIFLNANV